MTPVCEIVAADNKHLQEKNSNYDGGMKVLQPTCSLTILLAHVLASIAGRGRSRNFDWGG